MSNRRSRLRTQTARQVAHVLNSAPHNSTTTEMPIQWFPGHMHKAQLEIRASMPKTDVVIEVLDARIPYSSQNPLLAELRGNKPCLKVLAKSDLADESLTLEWQEYLEQSAGVRARIVTTEDTSTIRSLKYAAARMVPHREGKMVNALIVGIPNVGKSTLINVLAGKKLAKTGNVPAITKQQQRINIGDGVMLCDTPGILWHKVHNANSGYRLALVGSIQETAMDYGEVGFFGARYLAISYADRLQKRYDLDILPKTEMELVEAIGRKRGCISKNQIVDLDRASRILIADLRTGLLGRLTLETPSMMEQEIKKTAEEILEKAESEKAQAELKKKRFKDKQRAQQQARENRNHQG